ncbi:MAG: indole-3-glycerol-phosphate synthase [Dictyoglomus thermophilum]|uniref:indole-3-glycerol-phosphate synthase n=1 Tax=Dictyoglomus thermophilum TaxID=14 RepID=A0A7V4DYL8_DICTH|nr:indole-3-glycerol-phosphate synthase [Dictyoglomus thermophilum]MCX7720271.1 indole-3-glycerol-phosphate synthase [Dictyoglomus thermophilum]TYT23267.1 indole-3-glycerol-phosphate synthase [Dictyoglomus thermophilum]
MNILDKLVEEKRKVVFNKIYKIPTTFPEKEKDYFFKILNQNRFNIIGEVKPASPVKGKLLSLPISEMAKIYDDAKEISAISVLTAESFSASMNNLSLVRKITKKPILQKDFVIIPEQIYEGRILGADAVLLIARVLSEGDLKALYNLCLKLDVEPIIEVYDEKDLEKVLNLRPRIIMINNRDLTTFKVDINNTLKLLPYMPSDILVISASGIKDKEEVRILYESGVRAILVGESIVTSQNPKKKIEELFEVCGLKSVE